MSDLYYDFYITFIFEDRWTFFFEGFLMTMVLTISSFILGSVIGAVFCALMFSKNKVFKKLINLLNSFLVQLPTLVLLMIFVYVVFVDTNISTVIVAIVGLTIKNAAYMADIFYSAVSSVSEGEIEAARALGMSKSQAFFYVTLPQAINNAVSIYQNQFVSCLQETSVVGTLAISDLTKMSSIITSRTLKALFSVICISVIYILIGYLGTSLISLLNKNKHLNVELGDEQWLK